MFHIHTDLLLVNVELVNNSIVHTCMHGESNKLLHIGRV